MTLSWPSHNPRVFPALALVVASLAGGCSASSSASGADAQAPQTPAQCGAIEEIPPVLNLWNAATGAPICDPNVTLVESADAAFDGYTGNLAEPCAGGENYAGCPSAAPDGGTLACTFVLFGAGAEGAFSVEVAAPGFQSKVVSNVKSGEGGCVAMVAASQLSVSLEPAPAKAADSGAD